MFDINKLEVKEVKGFVITPNIEETFKFRSCSHHSGEAELWQIPVRIIVPEEKRKVGHQIIGQREVICFIELSEHEAIHGCKEWEGINFLHGVEFDCSAKHGSEADTPNKEISDILEEFFDIFDPSRDGIQKLEGGN